MSATITLPMELESLLAERAAVEGTNVEQFALEALRRVAERPTNGSSEGFQPNKVVGSASKPVPKVRRSARGVTDHSKCDEWLRLNRDNYRGQWVVLDGDRLIGHTPNSDEATALFKQARAEGVYSPFVQLIPLDDEPIWMMWS